MGRSPLWKRGIVGGCGVCGLTSGFEELTSMILTSCQSYSVLFFFFGSDQDELAYPVHHMVLETTSRNRGSEPSGATMIPHLTVVADLTRNED